MFQSQATPYSSFASYGLATSIANFSQVEPDGVTGGGSNGGGRRGEGRLVVDSRGSFREPNFAASNNGSFTFDNTSNLNNSTPTNNSTNSIRLHDEARRRAIHSHSLGRSYSKMATCDMETQEALAKDYHPRLQGSLVGDKKSSHAIADEYAKADPIYVAKTAALPHSFSHYRPILGDGNCGWRAAGFAYFETLIMLGKKSKVDEEVARMMSLNNLITNVGGFDSWMIEDITEETSILLKELANVIEISPQAAMDILTKRFNDINVSPSLVYHLRLLASSWMKGSPDLYQGFIPDGSDVDGYRRNWLEPVDQEIDHLVEIVYLDRSEGSQANSHLFQQEDSNGIPLRPGGPTIHLLYRPSHYDILYKDPPMALVEDLNNSTVSVQVNRATNFTQQHHLHNTSASIGDFSQLDLTTLLNIPGFNVAPPPSHHGYPSQFHAPMAQEYSPSTLSASMSPISPGLSATSPSSTDPMPTSFPSHQVPQSSIIAASNSLGSPQAHVLPAFSPGTATHSPINTHMPPHQHPSMCAELSPNSDAPSFRPSKYEWEAAAEWQEPAVTFQTSSFKNSPYNTAHYNNPNFQPERWNPGSGEVPGAMGTRKRSY